MSTLADLITARLRVLEAAALAASNPPWTALTMYPSRSEVTNETEIDGGVIVRTPSKDDADAAHIAMQDPAATLALVAGLRTVVSLHEPWISKHDDGVTYTTPDRCGVYPCATLVALADALGVTSGEAAASEGVDRG